MKKLFISIFTVIMIFSCNKDESSEAEVLDFSVTSVSDSELEIGSIQIDSEFNRIYILFDQDLSEFSSFSLTIDINLSPGAKTSSLNNGMLSFTNSDEVKTIEVEAEDGFMVRWYVYLIHHQIQNSGFENWFDNLGMNGRYYKEIGTSDVTSIWATANMGTSIYAVYGTQPLDDGSNTLAEITTDSTSQVPVTAGALFVGTFNLSGAISHPTDPKQATDFGLPYTFRPSEMKVKFKYQAGETYVQATLNETNNIFGGFTVNEIEGEDMCSIYTILEVRNGDQITEIGRAELYSETTDDVLTEITIPFEYTSTETPTHISVVFSSSKDGDLWKGAVGSTLVVDDLELIFE